MVSLSIFRALIKYRFHLEMLLFHGIISSEEAGGLLEQYKFANYVSY